MPDLWMDVNTALSEVPVNIFPLIDDTDFKTREEAVAWNQAGMDLVWNFVTPAGAMTQTAVTPTTGGDYDWAHQGNGMYSIEITASGGASIDNDTEGVGWFSGFATGVLPWRGPTIGFRAAGLNDLLVDSAFSATRGLAGTALPDAAADAAGGLPVSDTGGLDLDVQIGTDIDAILVDTTEIGAAGAGLTAVPWNAAWDAEVQSECADALTVYDPPTKAEMDGVHATTDAAIAALNDLDGAAVNAEVVDALNVDTYAEPGQAAPAATASIVAKLGYLYKMWRNKKMQDATTFELYNDAGAVVDQKATISDDGTDYTHGKIATGP